MKVNSRVRRWMSLDSVMMSPRKPPCPSTAFSVLPER